jgi:hypothetical protein
MSGLIERMRVAREQWVTVGMYEFLVRRPTAVQLARWQAEGDFALLSRVLVGWRNVREHDLVPGGDGAAAPWDAEVAVEWLEDRPELYVALIAEVHRILEAHFRAREELAGK